MGTEVVRTEETYVEEGYDDYGGYEEQGYGEVDGQGYAEHGYGEERDPGTGQKGRKSS